MNYNVLHSLIAAKGFHNYTLVQGVFKKDDWTNGLSLGNQNIVVYDMNIVADISLISDFLTKGLMLLSSRRARVNYSNLVKLQDVGGMIQLSSSFVSFHDTKLSLEIINPGLLTANYTGHFLYYTIKPEERKCTT